MEYPLAYYSRRNAEITRRYQSGESVASLCDCYELKEARMRQILELPRTAPKPPPPMTVSAVLKHLDLTTYRVRGALLRSSGSWPY